MRTSYKKMQRLFLRQSYLDAWEDYRKSLTKVSFLTWDYLILTASNEEQARNYREQIAYRQELNLLPKRTKYVVLADPDGKRVGSGGATLNVLAYVAEQEQSAEPFLGKRILVIHSGGDSKRIPQYSALGKLFSPVPRTLPNKRNSTLFDEFIIAMSGVPSRMKEGMLVLSGDVLLLFNPLQLDLHGQDAAAISFKGHVDIGKEHGVFLNDGNGYVGQFLHKQSEEQLRKAGAVNDRNCVDLDTGAVVFSVPVMNALYSLIGKDGITDRKKYQEFINEKARISFYGDFLYPLAKASTLEQYYKEAPEGSMCRELTACREKIWQVLSPFSMSLLCCSPAEFIHFGTTDELSKLMSGEIENYEFLDWSRQVGSVGTDSFDISSHNSYAASGAVIGKGVYLEDSCIYEGCVVGENAILSNIILRDMEVPADTVLHGLLLRDKSFVIRVYAVKDNPKKRYGDGIAFLHTTLERFMEQNALSKQDIWNDEEDYLWFANLYPVCSDYREALKAAQILLRMAEGKASVEEIDKWKKAKRVSLCSGFNAADGAGISRWQRKLENELLARSFINELGKGRYYEEALQIFGSRGITTEIYRILMRQAKEQEFRISIRIYYALFRFMQSQNLVFDGENYELLENRCFGTIGSMIYENAIKCLPDSSDYRIAKDSVKVELPVRVNWGGGWTDTPPQCNEMGGVVLNAAIKVKGILPVQVTVKRLEEYRIEFECCDSGDFGIATSVSQIQDCHNPFDAFALHKAALIACGLIPLTKEADLEGILKQLGGGIYLSTQVTGIPKGSGLGTSSILSGACVKGLFEFLGQEITDDRLYDIVLCMEQIMSTGGGWQDQVGGLTNGIKFITTKPGIHQKIKVEYVNISEETKQELSERFALIYTGQRRLARNLLRDVVGNYIGGKEEAVSALKEMPVLAALMRFELERGNVDEFAKLLNRHWELSKQLDAGSTNTCIDQMFASFEDMIDGRFIAGAGGGGFLQVILKKGVSRQMLRERLAGVFEDSGVDVWECEFI